MRYVDAVVVALKAAGKEKQAQEFAAKYPSLSNDAARALARSFGVNPHWVNY